MPTTADHHLEAEPAISVARRRERQRCLLRLRGRRGRCGGRRRDRTVVAGGSRPREGQQRRRRRRPMRQGVHDDGTITPAPNSSWAAGRKARPTRAVAIVAASAPRRALASGATAAISAINTASIRPPGDESGSPARTVPMALPWTSGPDMTDPFVRGGRRRVLQPQRLGADDDDLVAEGLGGTRPRRDLPGAGTSVRGGPA